ncbi:MAG: beta-ketoacyl synthase N-terminal-like domain-containing protein, partial [Dehalococcoidales bacterium]
MTHRVVVTGYGAVSPLGNTADETWQNLIAGTSGIETIKCFDPSDFSVKVAGEVKGFDPVAFMDPRTAKYTDRFAQFAIAAAKQAIEHSGLVVDDENRYEI